MAHPFVSRRLLCNGWQRLATSKQPQSPKGLHLIRMHLPKCFASGRKAFLTAFVTMSLYPLPVHPTLAGAQSSTDSDDPATYNIYNAKTVLPLQICYYNG
jgi:hypothetical protein